MTPWALVPSFVICATLSSGFAKADPAKDCVDTFSGEVAITGCSKLIDLHKYQGHSLSVVYYDRGLARQNSG